MLFPSNKAWNFQDAGILQQGSLSRSRSWPRPHLHRSFQKQKNFISVSREQKYIHTGARLKSPYIKTDMSTTWACVKKERNDWGILVTWLGYKCKNKNKVGWKKQGELILWTEEKVGLLLRVTNENKLLKATENFKVAATWDPCLQHECGKVAVMNYQLVWVSLSTLQRANGANGGKSTVESMFKKLFSWQKCVARIT